MDKSMVVSFNKAYADNVTLEEKQLVKDMLAVWGKFDTAVAKKPSMYKKGIFFGIALEKAIATGEIVLPEVRASRKKNKPLDVGEN